MKVVVIGASGQLGTELVWANSEKFGYEMIPLYHKDIEITDFYSSYKVLKEISPDVVINTAAFVRVDDCEDLKDDAFKVNAVGPRNLAVISGEVGFRLVHISTDYVFDGTKDRRSGGYTEFDVPNPINVYGESKLAGENLVRDLADKYYIVRTSWLYGAGGSKAKGGNFVTKMLELSKSHSELKVVNDQIGTPTNSYHLAVQILELVKHPFFGIYHATCEGMASWYDFAVEIFKIAGVNVKVIPVDSSEFPTRARRPAFSVLENYMLKLHNLNLMPDWKDALKDYLKNLV